MVFSITTADGRIINVRADSIADVRALFPNAQTIVENTQPFSADALANIEAVGSLATRERLTAAIAEGVPPSTPPELTQVGTADFTTAGGFQPAATTTGTNLSPETLAELARLAQAQTAGGFGQFTPETQVGTFLGETVSPENVILADQFRDRITVADPAVAGNLTELQRQQGLFRNFATAEGLNPTGLGASAVNQQFAPARAAQTVGQQLAGQGFQSGLAPGAIGTDFPGFLNASGGFGNIGQTAGNVFGALLSQSDPNLQNQQFLNPNVLGDFGSFTNDANFILQLARASARNRIGGIAAQFGLPSNQQLQTRFQAAPQANFAQFAAQALGAG